MLSSRLPVAPVGGVPFRITRLQDAASWAVERAMDPAAPGLALRFANAYSVASTRSDPRYADLLQRSGMNFPDGAPVAWTLRRTGQPGAHRVRGPSFFMETLRQGTGVGLRHYFFGTSTAVLADLVAALESQVPGIIIVGASAPDFSPDPARLAAQLPAHVSRDTVDVVWVGLGSPKQDFVAEAIAAERGLLTAGVGAAFDFAAGSMPEAPKFIQHSGFEWLFRLLSEPRRLWRRYLHGNAAFIRLVLPQLIGVRSSAGRPARADRPRAVLVPVVRVASRRRPKTGEEPAGVGVRAPHSVMER